MKVYEHGQLNVIEKLNEVISLDAGDVSCNEEREELSTVVTVTSIDERDASFYK